MTFREKHRRYDILEVSISCGFFLGGTLTLILALSFGSIEWLLVGIGSMILSVIYGGISVFLVK
jgi:hypothetical protein